MDGSTTLICVMLFSLSSVFVVKAECPNNWTRHGDSCYHFSHGLLSWTEALTMCRLIGGEDSSLAEIVEAAEMAYLDTTVKALNTIFWIGGHDSNEENVFVWAISRQNIGVNNFTPGNPSDSGGDENCMTILADGHWNDDNCMKPHRFICEKPEQDIYNNVSSSSVHDENHNIHST